MNATLRKQLTGLMMAMGLIINLIAPPIFASSHLAPSNVVNKSRAASQTARSTTQRAAPASIQKTKERASEVYGKLPISFEANRGQTDPSVRFLARGSGYNLFLTPTEAVLNLRKELRGAKSHEAQAGRGSKSSLFSHASSLTSTLRMKLVGANEEAQITGEEQLPGRINYLTGRDAEKWQRDIASYAKVRYQRVYPGVDMIYYGNQRELEYDFVVAPGARPSVIKLAFTGARKARIAENGDLVLRTDSGEIRQRRPLAYQETNGARQSVPARYIIRDGQVGFQVASYDTSKSLVIDPVLSYSTYLGGSGNYEVAFGVAVDADGNAYIAGTTASADYPVTPGAFQPAIGGNNSQGDAFVTKLNAAGTGLVYSTYLGGSARDFAWDIAVDAGGNAYVTGDTESYDFPTTAGAFQVAHAAGTEVDAFVVKLNATGSSLVYSTYLGGSGNEDCRTITVNPLGEAYVAGETPSTDFPVTLGAYRTVIGSDNSNHDVFVTKLNATGTALGYSTFLGGSSGTGLDLALDSAGNAYVVGVTYAGALGGGPNIFTFPTTPNAYQSAPAAEGFEGFIAEVSADGTQLLYSSYLGGSMEESVVGVALDASGNVYVTGYTGSSNFPVTPGCAQAVFAGPYDTFIAKFNLAAAGAAQLIYATYLGGSSTEDPHGIAVDSAGNAYVAGYTESYDFPATETLGANGFLNAYVTKLNATGSQFLASTRFGDTYTYAYDMALDSAGNVYVVGQTTSSNFPTTPGAFSTTLAGGGSDSFVTKLDYTPRPSDVSIAMSAQPEPVETNATFTYSITVANDGPYQATGVSVTDVFPAGATLASVNASQGSCTQSDVGGITSLTCSLGSLGASATASLSFGVNANVPAGSTLQNAASVSSSSPDPNSANNSATTTTNVTANFNTHAGANSNVQLGGVSLTFNQVFGAGNTTATPIDPATAGQLPSGYLLNSNSFAYEITTTATYSAPITVCFDASAVTNDPAEFSNLRILHGESGVLVDRTILPPDSPAPDFGTKTICASVSSLSPFVLARKGTLYKVRALFDQTTAYKSGSTIPIKLQLTNANGVNVSSSSIVVTALSVVRVSTNTSGAVTDAGNANPDSNFRYDGGGYIFNLKTKGYASGTYLLRFKAGNDPSIYSLQFQVK
ncbi:MAG: hypothetical protein QOH63_3913 [Acidobacteriota bacterium]|jgi:uncharacterized repeat protein (TIGR01451 family)|nr:hypothetical protein [Acidobacteriota bacterium]